jgi:deazaflavin-dependent oxidoreductase (nitroreductase family)
MVLSARMAQFNKVATNRVFRLIAPWMIGFCMLEHRGRRSGRVYRIPIMIFRSRTGFVVALTYGAETDWVKNVIAAGGCDIKSRGHEYRLINPRIVHDESRSAMPPIIRQFLGTQQVYDFLHLDAQRPGTSAS